jgi:hypothetical protein
MSETTDFIKRMAAEAGQPSEAGYAGAAFDRVLFAGTVGAFALAVLLIYLVFAGTFDFADVLRSYPFHFKLGTMGLLAMGAFLTLRQKGVPGSSAWMALAALPGPLVLLLLAVFDRSGFPLLGRDVTSVPICFFSIVGASSPALLILLWVTRRAVVTRPAAAGASAGLLAGALGAAAYAIACKNDGAAFVLIWYGLAIGSVCFLGALIGQRYLRW